MKILLISTLFSPSVGGIETVSEILAMEFIKAGNEVIVVTDTKPDNRSEDLPFIVRNPGVFDLINLIKWCDISLHACISLKYIWPFVIIKRPVFVTHHTWYCRPDGSKNLKHKIKLFLTKYTKNISVSGVIQKKIPATSSVIENPFDQDIFFNRGIFKDRELIFLGRLVSDKGADVLLRALAILKKQNFTPKLSIVGEGPELLNLQKMAADYNIKDQVTFEGIKTRDELSEMLNRHRIMIIPSTWEEPYGIVALEGLACGLEVVASDSGGLKEALADYGRYFKKGDSSELANIIKQSLNNKYTNKDLSSLAEHLKKHYKQNVAELYLSEIMRKR